MQIIINALALSYSKILKLAWFCNLKLIELLVMVLNFNKQLIGRLKMVKMCNYIFNSHDSNHWLTNRRECQIQQLNKKQ